MTSNHWNEIKRRTMLKAISGGAIAMTAPGFLLPAKADSGSSLLVALSYAPKYFNPNYTFDGAHHYVNPNIFNKLITYYGEGSIGADLASSWEVSEDGLTYTFKLRDGVLWSDGEKFSSKDVLWTVNSLVEEKGFASEVLNGLEEITAPDDTTVVMKLSDRNSSFLDLLASDYSFVILPAHIYEGTDPRTNPANEKPIGTGPFVVTNFVAGDYIEMTANPNFFDGKPELEKLFFKFYPDTSAAVAEMRAGNVGYMTSTPSASAMRQLESVDGITVGTRNTPPPLMIWLGLNLRHPILSKLEVREALSYAIDREQINMLVYGGAHVPARTSYLSTSRAWNPDAIQPLYDVDKANQLLDEAGYPRDGNGTRFSIRYTGFNAGTGGAKEIGEVLRQQFADVGIDLQLEQYDFSIFADKILKQHDFDITWSAGPHGPDPQAFAAFVASDGRRNCMGYDNPKVDELFAEAKSSESDAKAVQKYQEIQAIIAEDLPRISILEWRRPVVYRSEYANFWWMEGFDQTPNDSYENVKKVES